jgi:hypothetical protein
MENQEQTQEQAPAQAELSIADLQNIRTLIDVAVRRGTFGATELSSVGAVFDRLNAFLSAVTSPPQEGNEAAPAETAPTE